MNDTIQRTLRIDKAVDAALVALAAEDSKEPAEYMADVLAQHAAESDFLGRADAVRVENEIAIKERARDRAREICAKRFDPNVTLRVFQEFRTDPQLDAIYRIAIGADPTSRGNHTQARINRSLGSIIKRAVGGEAETTANGHRINAWVSEEHIRTYTPLRRVRGTNKEKSNA